MTGTIGVGAQHLPREQRHRKLAELVRERIAIMNGELAARANAGTSAGNLRSADPPTLDRRCPPRRARRRRPAPRHTTSVSSRSAAFG